MVLTKRDRDILEFVDKFGAATTSQIQRGCFKGIKDISAHKKAQARLTALYKTKHIKRDRAHLNTEYVYYHKKTKLLAHQTLLVDVYLSLLKHPGSIKEFTPEIVLGDIRPDAKVLFDDGWYLHLFLVEIHMATNKFGQEKYETFLRTRAYKRYFEVFPKVLVVSDREIKFQESRIPFVRIPFNMDGIDRILRR